MLSIGMLSFITLSVNLQSVVMLNIIKQSVIHYTTFNHAEYWDVSFSMLSVNLQIVVMLNVMMLSIISYDTGNNAEYWYGEFHYAECSGPYRDALVLIVWSWMNENSNPGPYSEHFILFLTC